jgi:hypothetical protein
MESFSTIAEKEPRSALPGLRRTWSTARLSYRVAVALVSWHPAVRMDDLLGLLALPFFESGNTCLRLLNPISLGFLDEEPHDAAAGPAQVCMELLGPDEEEPGLVAKADGTHIGILV